MRIQNGFKNSLLAFQHDTISWRPGLITGMDYKGQV